MKKLRNNNGKLKHNFSISKKLKQEQKITDEFEIMLNSLSLEDIIALKIELASKFLHGKMYGLPLWDVMPSICRHALMKYALTIPIRRDCIRFLGSTWKKFYDQVKWHDLFSEKDRFLKDLEEIKNDKMEE